MKARRPLRKNKPQKLMRRWGMNRGWYWEVRKHPWDLREKSGKHRDLTYPEQE